MLLSNTPHYCLLEIVRNYLIKLWTCGSGHLESFTFKTKMVSDELCKEVAKLIPNGIRATIEEQDAGENEKTR